MHLLGTLMKKKGQLETSEEYVSYLDDLKQKMQKTHDVARKKLKQNLKLYKDRYDAGVANRKLEPGQAVWLYRPRRKKGVCPKLQNKWEKGHIVTERLDDVLYRVQKGRNGKNQVVHIQRLVPYAGSNPPKWWRPGITRKVGWSKTVQRCSEKLYNPDL